MNTVCTERGLVKCAYASGVFKETVKQDYIGQIINHSWITFVKTCTYTNKPGQSVRDAKHAKYGVASREAATKQQDSSAGGGGLEGPRRARARIARPELSSYV